MVQDTFLKTWDYIAQGKSITEMRAFLYRVASNCIVDQYRKRKTASLDYLQEKGFEPRLDTRGKLETEIEAKEVVEVLQQLDEKYRDAFIMRYVGELSVKEIAGIFGEAENTVSVHIHRAVKQVRVLLKHEG